MYRFAREAVIAAPPQAVFDYLTDQERLPEWSPEVMASEVVDGEVREGAVLRQTRLQGRRRMTNDVEVVAHEPPRRHAVRTRILGVSMIFTFTLDPEDGATRVRLTGELCGRGLAKLWEGRLGCTIERSDDRRLEALREAMERAGPAAT